MSWVPGLVLSIVNGYVNVYIHVYIWCCCSPVIPVDAIVVWILIIHIDKCMRPCTKVC
jgi:hypothetical protein